MKAIRVLVRNIKNAFKSVFRNLSLSVASIICTTITLLIVSIAVVFSVNLNGFTKDLENEVSIVIFLDKSATKLDLETTKENILQLENINKETIITKDKEEVKKEMMNKSESFKTIMSTWSEETNPLKHEIIVTVNDIRNIKETKQAIENMEMIDSAQCGEEMVEGMVTAFDIVKKISIGVIIALIVVTVFLICNTIKLTIFSRKSEIDIMRLVGTSNAVIKLPFVIEGMVLGIAGALIPIAVTVYGYIISYERLHGYFVANVIKMIDPMPFVLYDSILLLVIGGIVGMVGSARSVRKYLKI